MAIKNIKNFVTGARDPNKINLIKKIPNTNNYLLIGANRENGFFMVTHYEVTDTSNLEKLKSHLGRGDLIDRSGKVLAPDDFLVIPPKY